MKLFKTLVFGVFVGLLIYVLGVSLLGCATSVGFKFHPARIEIEAPVDR